MSVRENVMAATYGSTKASPVESMLRLPRARREEREVRALTEEVLGFFGERLAGYRWEQPAYSLSYANRRRLEIARALATRPKVLLLDEPAAGMNPNETHEVSEVIGRLRDELSLAILVIEHDMHVVEGISDRVVALDHGVKVTEGTLSTSPTTRPWSRPTWGATPRRWRRPDVLLKLDDVTTYYGKMRILEGITIEVDEGELVCLLGGNASGKSTTLKTILGLVRPRSGRVLLDAEDVTRRAVPDRIARGMAIVPENRRLFGHMTVGENLELGAVLRDGSTFKEDLDRVHTLFPRLHERREQLAGTLSGGEQQMVAMGRALMSQSAAAADGRAVDGAVPGARAAELPHHQGGPRVRRGRPDGGAERHHGAVDRRPRLRAGHRIAGAVGPGRGPAEVRGPQAGLPRSLRVR